MKIFALRAQKQSICPNFMKKPSKKLCMGQKMRILVCPLFCLFLSNKYCTHPLKFLKEALKYIQIGTFDYTHLGFQFSDFQLKSFVDPKPVEL